PQPPVPWAAVVRLDDRLSTWLHHDLVDDTAWVLGKGCFAPGEATVCRPVRVDQGMPCAFAVEEAISAVVVPRRIARAVEGALREVIATNPILVETLRAALALDDHGSTKRGAVVGGGADDHIATREGTRRDAEYLGEPCVMRRVVGDDRIRGALPLALWRRVVRRARQDPIRPRRARIARYGPADVGCAAAVGPSRLKDAHHGRAESEAVRLDFRTGTRRSGRVRV